MTLRTNLEEKDIIKNMIEIYIFLLQQGDDISDIECAFNGLILHFEVFEKE